MREGECPMIEGNGVLTIHLLLIIIGIVSKFLRAALIEGTEDDTFAAGKLDAYFLSLHLCFSDFPCHRIVKNGIREIHTQFHEAIHIFSLQVRDEIMIPALVAATNT